MIFCRVWGSFSCATASMIANNACCGVVCSGVGVGGVMYSTRACMPKQARGVPAFHTILDMCEDVREPHRTKLTQSQHHSLSHSLPTPRPRLQH